MTTEVLTVPKVYLKNPAHWKSGYHTAYATTRKNPVTPGEDPPLARIEFWFGIARNVPQNLYDLFAEAGVVTTERPKMRHEDD